MKNHLAILAAALALTTCPVWAADIVEQQVRFKMGTSGATISGSLKGDKIIDYKLRAAAGQTMTGKLRPSNLSTYFNVMPAGSETAFFIGSTSGNDYSG